jgi:hypothetical protein
MLPDFNDDGYLPAGVHRASMEEVTARFGKESELRRVQIESLGWLVALARRAGVERIIVNGSFVTDKTEPNDIDCALLIGKDFPRDSSAEADLLAGLPFLEIHLLRAEQFDPFVEKIFATDRALTPKGVVEVIL